MWWAVKPMSRFMESPVQSPEAQWPWNAIKKKKSCSSDQVKTKSRCITPLNLTKLEASYCFPISRTNVSLYFPTSNELEGPSTPFPQCKWILACWKATQICLPIALAGKKLWLDFEPLTAFPPALHYIPCYFCSTQSDSKQWSSRIQTSPVSKAGCSFHFLA